LLAKQPKVGTKASDFTLKKFDGAQLTLSELKGKVVLLDFWASWCAPCREELPFLDILTKTYGSKNFEVVAVNIDNKPEKAYEFLEKYSVQLMPVWDEEKNVVGAYDVETMPTTFIIDREGWIRYIRSGFESEQFIEYKKQIELLLGQNNGKSIKTTASRKQ
jgi:peroxiredoxin